VIAAEPAPPSAPGQWILEEGASLKINAHIDTLVGSGPGANIILEKGASLTINEHIGTLTAGPDGGTIVVGEGASLNLNLHADSATTGGLIVVPDAMKVHVDVHAKSDPVVATTALPAPTPAAAAEPAAPAPVTLPDLAPQPDKQARKSGEKDDAAGDVRDLRWRLLHDIVENFQRHQLEWSAARDEKEPDPAHGHGKALGHAHKAG
jgi:hypothetical protein